MRVVPALVMILVLLSCGNRHEEQKPLQPIKISSDVQVSDSFNSIDSKGRRQGIWLGEQNEDTVVYLNDTAYLIRGTTAHELWDFLKKKGKHKEPNIILKPDTSGIPGVDSAGSRPQK